MWIPTAAVVIEIESPDDETWDKLDFYANHGVDELLIVSAESRSVTWLALVDGQYEQVEESRLLGSESRRLADRIE
jgi:Uma2 family endonuclease